MTRTTFVGAFLFLLICVASAAHAEGSVEAGRAKGEACNSCHGKDGEGLSPVPPLAGLSADYFIRQMKAYATGQREHETMQMFAQGQSRQDLEDLSAYYASMSTPCGAESPMDAAAAAGPAVGDIEAGKQKAAKGGESSCNGCHGLHGRGDPENPRVAGMNEQYFVKQMNAFKSGEREHLMMQVVVQHLNDQDMADLAAYYTSLH